MGDGMRIWECTVPQRFDDKGLVNDWISMHMDGWFRNSRNSLFGYEDRFRALAEYWLKNGEHGPDYDDPNIIIWARSLG
jgi:hypothetical protein